MRLLVLGGSWFLGRVLVEDAVLRGHDVTTFNRGRTGVDVVGAEVVRGDREDGDDLKRLVSGRDWHAVIDTSGQIPCVVGSAAAALNGRAGAYVFVSTVSVYTGWPVEPVDEDSETYPCAPDADHTAKRPTGRSISGYGVVKAGSERAVHRSFDGRVLVVRPGVILGRYEYVGRLPWWLGRAARGGQMLAPGRPEYTIQPIDVRDVARFILDCLEREVAGTFNLATPAGQATMGALLGACVEVTGGRAKPVWVSDAFLGEQAVRAWTEIPLWRPYPGPWQVETKRAQAVGLRCRPIDETVMDTWTWLRGGTLPVEHERQAQHGIEPGKERRLLELWDRSPR
jgi:2'-hydroxyisoflavone reductase